MAKRDWYSLDNSAKVFPAITAKHRTNQFYVCAVLTERIEPEILTNAVNEVLARFPYFKVKIKRGVFWYYFEENSKPFKVSREEPEFLKKIDVDVNNDYLFTVCYTDHKISLNIFHALTDGNGGIELLKTIVYQYLILAGKTIKKDSSIISVEAPNTESEITDTSADYYEKHRKNRDKDPKSFPVSGTPFNYDGLGVVIGKMSVADVKEIAKSKGLTITGYLAAVYLYSVYTVMIKNKNVHNKRVTALIPVNMRKWFGSNTLRNFVTYVRIFHDFKEEVTFDNLLELCKQQMEEKIDREKLTNLMCANVRIEKFWLFRIIPIAIKDFAVKCAYSTLGDSLHTSNISNLGVVSIPEQMKEFVEDFFFILDCSKTSKGNVSVASYNNKLNIAFSRLFVETDIEKEFFRHFTNLGVDVEIISNYWEKRI